MKDYNWIHAFIIAAIILLFTGSWGDANALPQLKDARVCTTQDEVLRRDNGKIKRSMSLLRDFQKLHPCPSTGLTTGKCEGWALDHVIPLACGGCDSIENLQWLPNEIKSASGKYPKDRWERKINCSPIEIVK